MLSCSLQASRRQKEGGRWVLREKKYCADKPHLVPPPLVPEKVAVWIRSGEEQQEGDEPMPGQKRTLVRAVGT